MGQRRQRRQLRLCARLLLLSALPLTVFVVRTAARGLLGGSRDPQPSGVVDFPAVEGREWRAKDVYVTGEGTFVSFCNMNIADYQSEPWKTPMDQMLAVASNCRSRTHTRKYSLADLMAHQQRNPERYLSPSGFIHHETRCGSTLVANMIAHIPTALMVSESLVPYKALQLKASGELRVSEVRALFRALCFTQHHHDRCFFKLPGGTMLSQFQEVFPDTPWVFLFREPLDVVVSNMRGAWGKKELLYSEAASGQLIEKASKKAIAPCLRMPLPDGVTRDDAPEMRCAGGLDKICRDAMAAARARPDLALVLDYKNLPEAVTEYLWPVHFRQGPARTERDLPYMEEAGRAYSKHNDLPYMEEASHAYSKTMKRDKADFALGADADLKEKQLTDAIRREEQLTEAMRDAVETSTITGSYEELLAMQRWTKDGGLKPPVQ
ncbi:hypothetical protein JKP88DRAFT_353114 [Tribonema minus]|uniref:Sulfotransferase n=1 Tax=Tribonema minus TaxID=303371 RepID=A0A836CJX0_9STRA|nr:hypothetical protein JKP88DRAFT_353114 [Tribonema minus]